jgi:hypothetical protein
MTMTEKIIPIKPLSYLAAARVIESAEHLAKILEMKNNLMRLLLPMKIKRLLAPSAQCHGRMELVATNLASLHQSSVFLVE